MASCDLPGEKLLCEEPFPGGPGDSAQLLLGGLSRGPCEKLSFLSMQAALPLWSCRMWGAHTYQHPPTYPQEPRTEVPAYQVPRSSVRDRPPPLPTPTPCRETSTPGSGHPLARSGPASSFTWALVHVPKQDPRCCCAWDPRYPLTCLSPARGTQVGHLPRGPPNTRQLQSTAWKHQRLFPKIQKIAANLYLRYIPP